jgi:hypothetical protein
MMVRQKVLGLKYWIFNKRIIDMKKEKEVIVKQNSESPIAVEIIAQSIVKISECAKSLQNSGLSERAILLLLRDASGVGMSDIKSVLDSMSQLERLYLRGKK